MASTTVIHNDTQHVSIQNHFPQMNALDVVFLENGTSQIINTKGALYSWKESSDECNVIYTGEIKSKDNTDADLIIIDNEGKIHSLAPETPVNHLFPQMTVEQVACGSKHTLFLTAKRTVYALGSGPQTGLSLNVTENESILEPTLIPKLNNVISIHAGARHSVALVRSVDNMDTQNVDIVSRKRGPSITLSRRSSSRSVLFSSQLTINENFDNENPKPPKIDKYTEKLLEVEKLNTPKAVCPAKAVEGNVRQMAVSKEIANAVYVWGSGAQYQLGLGDNSDKLAPERIRSLSQVTDIACGAEHTTAVTVDGKMFAWGTLFKPSKTECKNCYPTPTLVINDNSIVKVMCGAYITMAILYTKKHGNSDSPIRLTAVLCGDENGTLHLESRDFTVPNKVIQMVTGIRTVDRGFVIYQNESDNENEFRRKLHVFCSEMKSLQYSMCDLQLCFDIKNPKSDDMSSLLRGIIQLLDEKLVFVIQTTFNVVDHIATRTVRLSLQEIIEDKLIKLLDEHRCSIEDYFVHLYYLQQHNAFVLIEKFAKDNEKYITVKRKVKNWGDKFEKSVPNFDLINDLAQLFSEMVQDNQCVKELCHRIQESSKHLDKSKINMLEMKEHYSELAIHVLEKLHFLGGQCLLISRPRSPRSNRSVPINVRQLTIDPNVPSFEKSMVILTNKSIIFIRVTKKDVHNITEWKLYSTWICHSSLDMNDPYEITLVFPEMKLQLYTSEAADFHRWKIDLTDAVYNTFFKGSLVRKNMDELETRNFAHQYMFGTMQSSVYNGNWKMGNPHGMGEMILKTSEPPYTHRGMFREGLRNGFGVCRIKHLSDSQNDYIEVRCGLWEDGEMFGFGMLQYQQSGECRAVSSIFKGHFANDRRNGFGIMDVDDEKYIGNWVNCQRHGSATIISFKNDRNGSLVDCEFENDRIKAGNCKVYGSDFKYTGEINEKRKPEGKGTFQYIISKTKVHEVIGNLRMRTDGSLEIKDGIFTTRMLNIDVEFNFHNEFVDVDTKSTNWRSIVQQCIKVLCPIQFEDFNNEDGIYQASHLTWDKVMSSLLKENVIPREKDSASNEISIEDSLSYYKALIYKPKFSSEDLERMENFVLALRTSQLFPITVFLDIRIGIFSTLVGVSTCSPTRIQKIVMHDLYEFILEYYTLLRHLFPVLPSKMSSYIPQLDETSPIQGYDFALACLPEDAYMVLSDILGYPCHDMDRAFKEEINKSNVADNFIDQLQIKNKRLLAVLREQELLMRQSEILSNDTNNQFLECVQVLKEIIPHDGKIWNARESYEKMKKLESLYHKITKFLVKATGLSTYVADDLVPTISYVVWRARPSSFYFRLNYIEKLNSHRITGEQSYILTTFQGAYFACCPTIVHPLIR